ncbi:hypothetical protein P9112_008834 [Eukaryota sp. TZLM1-RC]
MHPFVDPTVIIVAPKSNPSLVAPILRNADRTSCARFAEELRDFAIRMFLSRPASSTNAQLSRHSSRSSCRSARRNEPVEVAQPAEEFNPVEADHEEEENPEEVQYNLYDSIDEAHEPESLDLFSEDNENPENLYKLVDAHNSVANAEALMLQYIPRCMAPEVLDTLLIIHHISSRKPKKILDYILSCTKIEETAQAYKLYDCVTLNLNCRDAEEAISKVTQKTPTLQSNSQALTRKFLNGIRPEPLKRLLKSEAEDFLISSIPEILKRLTDLLPEYHRPYSKHYQLFEDRLANKYSGNPNRRINNQRSRRTPNRRYVTPNQEPRSIRSNASRSTQPQARTDRSNKSPHFETICNYCKKPGHVVRDCPDPNCKLSQVNKKKLYKNPRNPTHSRTHSTRNKTQSNSIVESIKEGLKEDYSIDETYYSRTVTYSSSSDTEDLAYNVSLNPLSINSHSYSEDTLNSPSPNTFLSDFNCYDLDDVFENLDFALLMKRLD